MRLPYRINMRFSLRGLGLDIIEEFCELRILKLDSNELCCWRIFGHLLKFSEALILVFERQFTVYERQFTVFERDFTVFSHIRPSHIVMMHPQQIHESISEKKQRLKDELHRLEEEEEDQNDNEKYTNEFEDLLEQKPVLIHNVVNDILGLTMESIRLTSPANMPALLQYFEGKTPCQKKQTLIRFLQTCPEYKTTDTKLLQKRLERLRRAAQYSQDVGMEANQFFTFIKNNGFLLK